MHAVRFAESALRDAETIQTWWLENRPAAPQLFTEELRAATELIGDAPDAGRVFRRTHGRTIRRTLLRACRFHVYYERMVDDAVVILAIHGAVRGTGPSL